ncbi:MAG: hypothetical protein H0U73_07845 [Tatlockia sp.]|nr:hypothetical protein [Tatlockia sp.]
MSKIGQDILKALANIETKTSDLKALINPNTTDYFFSFKTIIQNLKTQAENHDELDLDSAKELNDKLRDFESTTLRTCIHIMNIESDLFEQKYSNENFSNNSEPPMELLTHLLDDFKTIIPTSNETYLKQLREFKTSDQTIIDQINQTIKTIEGDLTKLAVSPIDIVKLLQVQEEPKLKKKSSGDLNAKSPVQTDKVQNQQILPEKEDLKQPLIFSRRKKVVNPGYEPAKTATNIKPVQIKTSSAKTNLGNISPLTVDKEKERRRTLRNQIEADYQAFETAAKKNAEFTFKKSEINIHCQNDPVINENLKRFEDLEAQSAEVLATTQKSWISWDRMTTNQDEIIAKLLIESIKQLTDFDTEKSNLKQASLTRQTILIPPSYTVIEAVPEKKEPELEKKDLEPEITENKQSSSPGFLNTVGNVVGSVASIITTSVKYISGYSTPLTPEEQLEVKNLQVDLSKGYSGLWNSSESFFKIFYSIELTNHDDPIILQATNQLSEIINVIHTNLNLADMPVDKNPLSGYNQSFLSHLSKKSTLTQEKIDSFIRNSFTPPMEKSKNIDELKRQNVALRGLKDRIDNFPIAKIRDQIEDRKKEIAKNIQNTNLRDQTDIKLQQLMNTQTDAIIGKKDELKACIDTKKLTITNAANLFSMTYNENLIIKSSRIISQKFTNLSPEVTTLYENNKKEIEGLLTIEILTERLSKITSRQEQTLNALQVLENKFNALGEEATLVNQQLSSLYVKEKENLVTSLETAVNQAEAILEITYINKDGTVDLSSLVPYKDKLAEIKNFALNTEFHLLEPSRDTIIKGLEKCVKNARTRLSANKLLAYQNIQGNFSKLSKPEFDKNNPFEGQLNQKKNSAEAQIAQAWDKLKLLENTKADKLVEYCLVIDNAIKEAEKTINDWDDTLKRAQEIEQRLGSNKYKTSIQIIEKLEAQYTLISSQFIKKKFEPKEEQTQHENNVKLLLENKTLDKHEVSYLNTIDVQLVKLFAIRNEFIQINKDYINEELDFKSLSQKRSISRWGDEFKDIFAAHIDEAMINNKANQILSDLKNRGFQFLLEKFCLYDLYQEPLNLIHPDLYKLLLKIHQEPSKEDDNECYIKLLLSTVNEHLHNNQMEHFSEDKRWEITQFIRIYVIKPLQALINSMVFMFSKEKTHHPITIFATNLEAEMVKMGNDAVHILQPSPSAA